MIAASPTIRLMTLFLRQRAVPWTVVALGTTFSTLVWLGDWVDEPDQSIRMVLVLIGGSAAIGSILGVAMWSPALDLEMVSPFPLRWPRLVHLGTLFSICLVATSVVIASWTERVATVDQLWFWTRNLLAMLGLTLLAAWLAGARLSWILPVVLAMVAAIYALAQTDDPATPGNEMLAVPGWLIVARNDASALSWIVAITLFVAGCALFAMHGPRVLEAGEAA